MLLYKSFANAAAIGTAVMCLGSPASAQTPCEAAELFDAAGGTSDVFGTAVAIDGLTAVVGAVYNDDNAWNGGAVSVFRFDPDTSSWVQEQNLVPNDGSGSSDYFGRAVAVVGNTVVIGVPRDDDNGEDSGSAYVFGFDGSIWIQQQKILPSDGAAGDEFGTSVALEGDTLVIGTIGDADSLNDLTSATVSSSLRTTNSPSISTEHDLLRISPSLMKRVASRSSSLPRSPTTTKSAPMDFLVPSTSTSLSQR